MFEVSRRRRPAGILKVTTTVKMEAIHIFRQHSRRSPRGKPKGTMHVQPNFRRKRKKRQNKRRLEEKRRLLEKTKKKQKQIVEKNLKNSRNQR